jgi:hypothetical protein
MYSFLHHTLYIHVQIYVYINIYICIISFLHSTLDVRSLVGVDVGCIDDIYTYICINIYTYIYTYMYTYIYMHIYEYDFLCTDWKICIYIYTYIYPRCAGFSRCGCWLHWWSSCELRREGWIPILKICIYVYILKWMYMNSHRNIYLYMHKNMCNYLYIYALMVFLWIEEGGMDTWEIYV